MASRTLLLALCSFFVAAIAAPPRGASDISSTTLRVTGTAAHGPVQVDAWGSDSIRVRFAPVGGAIVETPLIQGLLPTPAVPGEAHRDGDGLVSGNLRADVDAASGLVTLTRVSDGAVVLRQTSVAWGGIGARPSAP